MDLRRNINEKGQVVVEQGVIVGCAGGMYENIAEAADILRGRTVGNGYFSLSVYPASAPIALAMAKDGLTADLLEAGALVKSAFCGPCFGAGDTPAHNTLSVRHATRNFANREGSKPSAGQIAAVALMDARSIAATALSGGVLTAATDIDYTVTPRTYRYTPSIYEKRVYNGFGKPDPSVELRMGPNIADWPKMPKMEDDLLVRLCAVIRDEVTTTDKLIRPARRRLTAQPHRALRICSFRRVPEYVGRAKAMRALDEARAGKRNAPQEALDVLAKIGGDAARTVSSCIFARSRATAARRAGGVLSEGSRREGEYLL